MNLQEKNAQLLEELIEGVDRGDFQYDDKIPVKYTYEHLTALFCYANQLDGGKELYQQLYTYARQAGILAVKEKFSRGETVKITFLAISAAEWPADELYRILEQDNRFDVSVTNVPLTDRNIDDRTMTYEQNKRFFEGRGYRILDTYSVSEDKVYTWEELGEIPDIVVHLTYWQESLPESYRISNFPFRYVNLYIPYSFNVENSASGQFLYNTSCNNAFFNIVGRAYMNTKLDVERYQEYQLLQGQNIVYSGYAKMDYFYQEHTFEEADIRRIWKIPAQADARKIKKVIIAPHHSFLGYAGLIFSTFAKNAHFWIYLAQKYQDQIAFVFKPHPNLRLRSVEAGVFKNSAEYDAYIEKWNALPNAKVITEDSYLELFATSDAMIMDSLSFIAEYMYADKPLLYLTRPEQIFSELGKKCLSAYCKAEGSDYMAIEKFIIDTVINGNDELKEHRKKAFSDALDYVSDNGCSASEYIYKDLYKIFI
ncbi:MAG: CDP-glycerol glycerophosphotransferase family protein [Acetatifactor sp.]|nr:CDP-glycerol glycerophosphotransferase family protein [Acetatifactor sp.]